MIPWSWSYVFNGLGRFITTTKRVEYEFALIDLSMPVMTGLEMARIVRKQHNPLKLAAISSFVLDNQKIEALDAGFDYCLTRPVDEEQLQALINPRQT